MLSSPPPAPSRCREDLERDGEAGAIWRGASKQQETKDATCARFFRLGKRRTSRAGSLDRHDDLADLLVRFHVPMRLYDLSQREGLVNSRHEGAGFEVLVHVPFRLFT